MREIKFRAWHLIEGRWAMESEIENTILVNTFYHGGRFQLDERAKHGLANDLGTTLELMQYTGLKDKNGKEIYEGDQLFTPGNLTDELQYVGDVQWDEEDARWEVVNFHGRFEYIPSGCVVNGNIYETPHLAVMEA